MTGIKFSSPYLHVRGIRSWLIVWVSWLFRAIPFVLLRMYQEEQTNVHLRVKKKRKNGNGIREFLFLFQFSPMVRKGPLSIGKELLRVKKGINTQEDWGNGICISLSLVVCCTIQIQVMGSEASGVVVVAKKVAIGFLVMHRCPIFSFRRSPICNFLDIRQWANCW